MATLTRQSQMDKARETLRDVVSYADAVIRDERLRADLRAAIGHGAEAGNRIKADVDGPDATRRLADDKKLRKHVRAALADLDKASDRLRRKRRHRVRNVLLIVAAVGAAVAIVPSARRWLSGGEVESESDSVAEFAV